MNPNPPVRALMIVGVAIGVVVMSAETRAATTHTVTLSGFSYSPSSLTISEGDSIHFQNTSGFHSATCEQGEPNCGSHSLASSPWDLTVLFNLAGTYRYRCMQHSTTFGSGMIFSVTVLPKGTHLVTLSNTQYTPATLTIPVGDTVMFQNISGTHSATCEQSDPNCGSHPLQSSPWTLTHQFNVPGTYHYRCQQHSTDFNSGMIMTLTVEGPPTPVPARLANARIQGDQLQFDVTGTPGGMHVVEGSEDFTNWIPLKTNTPPDGIFGFTEPVSLLRRYYRVRQ